MKKLFISQPMRWKDYRGCKIEHECAVQYGIDIVGE